MEKDSKKTRDHTKTIDEKHSDMMNIFYVIENETIPKLLDEKQTIHSALKQTKMYSDEYHELKEKLEDIKNNPTAYNIPEASRPLLTNYMSKVDFATTHVANAQSEITRLEAITKPECSKDSLP